MALFFLLYMTPKLNNSKYHNITKLKKNEIKDFVLKTPFNIDVNNS